MQSKASRASEGTTSASRVWVEPKRRVMNEDRNEPSASAANSGTVIILFSRGFQLGPLPDDTPVWRTSIFSHLAMRLSAIQHANCLRARRCRLQFPDHS